MVVYGLDKKSLKMATGRLEHFTVNPHDPALDWSHICYELFGHNKCMVMLENKKKNTLCPHVHVQGVTDLASSTFADKVSLLITTVHWKRKLSGHEKSRPCKRVRSDVTGLGFQYICKQSDSVLLHSRGFTDSDLETLKQASEDYVEQLKHGAEEFVWSTIKMEMPYDSVVSKARYAYLLWLEQEGKPISPSFRTRVLTVLLRWPEATPEFKFWLAQHI